MKGSALGRMWRSPRNIIRRQRRTGHVHEDDALLHSHNRHTFYFLFHCFRIPTRARTADPEIRFKNRFSSDSEPCLLPWCHATAAAEDTLVRNSLLFIHLPAMMMTVNGQIPILFIRICLKFVCFCVPAASTTSHDSVTLWNGRQIIGVDFPSAGFWAVGLCVHTKEEQRLKSPAAFVCSRRLNDERFWFW